MVRAVRLAATLGLSIEHGDASRRSRRMPALVEHLSGERVGAELQRLLEAPGAVRRAPAGDGHGASSRSLAPELAAQRGIPQNKTAGEDLWDHTLRTVDAVAGATARTVRLAALLHDVGQAVDARRRPVPPPRRRGGPDRGCAAPPAPVPAHDDRGRDAPRRPPHVHRRRRPVRCRGASLHPADRHPRTSTTCSSCDAPTTSAAACRPDDPATAAFRARVDARGRGPSAPRSLRPRRRRRRPHPRARPGPGAVARPGARRAARAGPRRPGPERSRLP